MKIITTFEHTFIPYADILPVTDESSLNSLKGNVKRNFKDTLSLELDGLKINGFVGVIKLDNTIIEVLPKFYKNTLHLDPDEKKGIYKNLYYMINKSMKMPTYNIHFENFDVSKGSIFDFIIFMFLQNLYRALIKGTYKTYITEEVNSKYIKGKILVNKTIVKNMLGLSVYSETDKYTEDNLVNQIFKYAVKSMHNNTSWNNNKRIARQILMSLTDIQDIHVHDSIFSKIKKDRLLGEFEHFLNFSRFYINNQTMTNYKSSDNSSFIFNIKMEDVYQEYIASLLIEYASDIINTHQIRTQKSSQHLIYDSNDKGKYELIPDIIIEHENVPTIIIDTKYKLLEDGQTRNGVKSSDLYQMFGYYHKYKKPRIVLLYPQYQEIFNDTYFFYEEKVGLLNISTINLSGNLYTKLGELEVVDSLREIIFPRN